MTREAADIAGAPRDGAPAAAGSASGQAGQLLSLAGPAVLLCQIVDSLELSLSVSVHTKLAQEPPDELEQFLAEAQAQARELRRNVETGLTYDGDPVMMWSAGLNGRRYAMETSAWHLCIAGEGSPVPRFVVLFHADHLLSYGVLESVSSFKTWTENELLPMMGRRVEGAPVVWRVARLDLAADIAGVGFSRTDLDRFVTRSKRRREIHMTHSSGRRLNGMNFSQRGGPIYARLYLKTDEKKGADESSPIRTRWSAAGYLPDVHGVDVWRCEFEVRGSLLRALRNNGAWLPREPEDLLREGLPTIWQYCAGEWLTLRKRFVPSKTHLEEVEPWWAVLAARTNFLAVSPSKSVGTITRAVPPPTRPDRLYASAVGYLVTLGASQGAGCWHETIELLNAYYETRIGADEFVRRLTSRQRGWGFAVVPAPPDCCRSPSRDAKVKALSSQLTSRAKGRTSTDKPRPTNGSGKSRRRSRRRRQGSNG